MKEWLLYNPELNQFRSIDEYYFSRLRGLTENPSDDPEYFYCIPHNRRWIFNRGNTLRERCAYRRASSLRPSQRVLRRERKDG